MAPGLEQQQTFNKVSETVWPGSCPSEHEETVISLVCGNTHLGWAMHLGVNGKFLPQLFWRTPSLNNDEIQTGDPCSILERYLPNGGHELIFGSQTAPADKAQATKTASTRRIPLVSVYVVSTNPDNEAGVEFLFRDIPCRIFRLKASDFFSEAQGVYPGIGTDRLANVKAASKFYKHPLLVLDGGTAMTYTGTDAKGNIIGGGICPGLASTFRGMHDFTGSLPLISQEEINRTFAEIVESKKPLPAFATDTKSAMLTGALKTMAEISWSAVDEFRKVIVKEKGENSGEDPEGPLFTVAVTGGDGDVIYKLLQPDHDTIIPRCRGDEARAGIEIHRHKHLIHYGIGLVLEEKTNTDQSTQTELSKLRNEIVGQRVAKEFIIRKEAKVYRGSVAAVAAGKTMDEDWFYVRYDDGDTEHLSLTGLYDGLVMYKKVGEDYKEPEAAEKVKAKVESSEAIANRLVAENAMVKKHSETPVGERKKNKNNKRPAADAKKPPPEKKSKTRTPSKKQISPFNYIGQRVAKYFGEDIFFGTIKKYIEPSAGEFDLWHVVYDDSDEEDYDSKDLKKAIALYKQKKSEDKVSLVDAIAGVDAENQAKPRPTRKGEAEAEDMEVDTTDAVASATVGEQAAPVDEPAPVVEVAAPAPSVEVAAPAPSEPAAVVETAPEPAAPEGGAPPAP